jgi:pSer/pThr/pTyr-binding forkhead associated (FHA) protein
VSRFHARLTVTDAGVTIDDLGSKNGTTVGGTRLASSATLRDGDEIRFGSVVTVFREWLEGRPTVTLGG